ncbi:MAG: hypothetical protein WC907_00560 [Acholeplasmataceae bacterium]
MNIKNKLFQAKKIAILMIAFIFALTLVACKDKTGTPYGSIDDSVYMKVGDYQITNKELYDEFRLSSVNRLISMIEEMAFDDVEIDFDDLTEFEVENFEKEILKSLISESATPSSIASLPDYYIARQIISYVDSFVIVNPDIDKDLVIDFLEEVIDDVIARADAVDFDEDASFVYGFLDKDSYPLYTDIIDTFIKQYKLPVLKKVFAKSILGDLVDDELTGELADEDSDVYIKESDIVSQYKNNVAGKYNVKALIIEFTSVKEHEIARYKHAIKSNSRGEWFKIPNLSDQDVIDQLKLDNYEDTDPLGKAKKIITDSISSGGLGISLSNLEVIDYRSPEFATYYNKYSINSNADVQLDDAADSNEVLNTFLEIYDELNGTDFATSDLTELAKDNPYRDTLEDYFTFEYTDNLLSKNTSLRSYVYGLDTESMYYETLDEPNEDGKTYARPYSRQVQTFNSKPYLVYLLDDDRLDDENILDDNDKDNVVFMDNELAQSKRTEALEILVKNKLSSSYVTKKVNEKLEDLKVDIFDSVLRDFYANQKDYNGSKGFKNNDVLATVDGKEILVDDFFDKVEESLGLSTALDNLLVQKLKDNYGDQITAEDEKEFRKQLEDQYVNPFLANQYAQAGFPSKIGLDKFFLLAFGVQAKDGKSATRVALEKIYIETKIRELFEDDLEAHYKSNTADDNIYLKFAELAKLTRDNEISIQASHLLVYLDLDGDDNPDDPRKIDFAKANLKDIDDLDDLEAVINEFVTEINKRAKLKSTMQKGLEDVVSSYNEATRYTLTVGELPENPTKEEVMDYLNQYNKDDVWVKYKSLGLKLKFESLGEINNQTNFPSDEGGGFDVDFFEYSMALANHVKDELEFMREDDEDANVNEILPLYAPELTDSDIDRANFNMENTRSGFGWHMILVTGYNESVSAKVEAISDSEKEEYTSKIDNPYVDDQKLVGYNNDSDNLTWEQILIYMKESKEETGVVTLSTKTQNAINKYFQPIFNKFNSSYSQLNIAFNYLFDNNINLEGELGVKLDLLLDANLNQFNSYAFFDGYDGLGNSIYDKATSLEYMAIYSTWYDILG